MEVTCGLDACWKWPRAGMPVEILQMGNYAMQADDSADTANRRKTYIKQPEREMWKSPKRFCLLTSVLIGDAPIVPYRGTGVSPTFMKTEKSPFLRISDKVFTVM